jgi:hypothetical protein
MSCIRNVPVFILNLSTLFQFFVFIVLPLHICNCILFISDVVLYVLFLLLKVCSLTAEGMFNANKCIPNKLVHAAKMA